MKVPKALQKVLGKVDPRAQPDPKEVRKFKDGAGRRYMNVGIATIAFYRDIAVHMKDKELKEYARNIMKAVYEKDDSMFKINTNLFQARMAELGVWKSFKGMSKYQKAKIMGKVAKLARDDKRNKEGNEKADKDLR